MTVGNFDLIEEFLKFESEDDFYFLQVIQRKRTEMKQEEVIMEQDSLKPIIFTVSNILRKRNKK